MRERGSEGGGKRRHCNRGMNVTRPIKKSLVDSVLSTRLTITDIGET